jgi:histidine triad (HIT) family protein
MEDCVFCGIVKENIPRHEIWYEDENHIAFLDIYPCQKGHTLVIPKKHTDNIIDLSEDEYTDLFKAVHRVSERLKSSFNSTKVSIVVDGYSINHVHVHLIPTNKEGDLGDFPRYTLADGELAKTGQELNDFKEV